MVQPETEPVSRSVNRGTSLSVWNGHCLFLLRRPFTPTSIQKNLGATLRSLTDDPGVRHSVSLWDVEVTDV